MAAGEIVAVGSVNGLAALGDPAYSAAKAAMISLTRSLAQEYGRFGIRANIVLPGTVRTPLWQRARRQRFRRPGQTHPLVSTGENRRTRGCCASGRLSGIRCRLSAITGAALPVDCGLSAGNIVMARELTLEDF